MSNVAIALKDEITRLCRKEIRAQLDPLKKTIAKQRSDLADLKRRLSTAEREMGKSLSLGPKSPLTDRHIEPNVQPLRFVAKGLPSLRKRLGLSVEEMSRLLGVSQPTFYNWQAGTTRPQRNQLVKLAFVRTLGRKEARKLLADAD